MSDHPPSLAAPAAEPLTVVRAHIHTHSHPLIAMLQKKKKKKRRETENSCRHQIGIVDTIFKQ